MLAAGALFGASVLTGCTHKPGESKPVPTYSPTQTLSPTSAASTPTAPHPQHYPEAPTGFGTHLPGIVTHVPTTPGTRTIALTFDACGGDYDAALIQVLREYQVPATLFLAQPWIHAHPEVAAELVADPLFQIENHGTRHVPLTVAGQPAYGIPGTANPAEAIEEIAGNAHALRELGVDSRWFRAGTAHYDDVAVRIAEDTGMRIAGFATNGDFGASASASQVAHQIHTAPDGAIVLVHMNHPHSGTAAGVRHAIELLLHDATFTTLN